MFFFKRYNSLPNYLHRWTIFSINKLHVRLHKILCEDKTFFLHSHPFYFISIILKNGYDEELLVDNQIKVIKHRFGSVIFRKPNDFHRIKCVKGETITLFISWKVDNGWKLVRHPELPPETFKTPVKDGLYLRLVGGKQIYSKFENFWYIGNENMLHALSETRPSIHQCLEFSEIEK